MKTLFDHIDYVKGKPHHVRKRVALGAATLGSALVALVWLAGSSATGAFALHGSDFAMSTGQENVIATTSDSGSQNLAGVGAAAAVQQDAALPAHIEIIDAVSASAPAKQSEQTVLPF